MWGYWRVWTLVDWSLCPNFRMSLSRQQWVTSHIMRGHLYHCCPNFLFGMGHGGLWKAWLGREKGATQCQISRILSRGRWRQIYVWCRLLHRARLSETPWTVACQAPLSRGFSRQEYQRRLTFPSPGDLPNPGIKSRSPALQADFLPIWTTGEALKEMTTSHGMANMAKTEHTCLWTHQAAAELEVALSCSLSYLSENPSALQRHKAGSPPKTIIYQKTREVLLEFLEIPFRGLHNFGIFLSSHPNCTISQKKRLKPVKWRKEAMYLPNKVSVTEEPWSQGICYGTYTEMQHSHAHTNTPPQIHRSPTQPESTEGHGRGRVDHWLQRSQVPAWHTSLRSWGSS